MEIKKQTKTERPWHAIELEEVIQRLNTNPETGLSSAEIQTLKQTYGKNILPQGKKTTALGRFVRQFTSPLVYILLVAAVLTWWIGEYTDMTVILLVVAVNAAIGYYQEYRASKIFEKLKAIVRVEAIIIRGEKTHVIDSENLVPGDVIILKSGNKVPADARIIKAINLETGEALLTGESKPVRKQPGPVKEKTIIGDRTNMVFMGTIIEQGEGLGVVVATGAKTEIGKITLLAAETREEETPLQSKMRKLGKFITELFVAVSLAIFMVGLFGGRPPIEMVKTTIAVAVAAIPEGLPAAISVILAVAAQRIYHRQGLVMKLVAAETLGSTSVICADKTGTLTYGEMKVEKIMGDETGSSLAMALANEAIIEETEGKWKIKGESTDKAKLENFLEQKTDWKNILKNLPRLAFIPFNPDWKYIASFNQDGDKIRVFVSGAPEKILSLSKIPEKEKQELKKLYENLALSGFRVIAAADKTLETKLDSTADLKTLTGLVNHLRYLGLAAIRDPIREDVRETLKITREAGIKVMMITGDHVLTAKAIGEELGFKTGEGGLVSGLEIDELSDHELKNKIERLEIIARATPEHKIRIIDALQEQGAVVAMTGDGVNDAPALKSANIGVAIGSGTDVAKEASDLVLLNDSFSTITAAVQEGRTGFANIRKATLVVMSNAFTELTLITSSLLLATPFPITAVQILWVNLALDSLPVVSLAFEPPEKQIMKQKPLRLEEPILNRELKFIIFAVSIFTDMVLVGIFLYLLKIAGWEIIKLQSFIFTATAIPTLFNIFAFKSLKEPLHKISLFNNWVLVGSVILAFALMGAALYLPAMNNFLKTVPLSSSAILAILAFAIFKLILVELTKWWYNRK